MPESMNVDQRVKLMLGEMTIQNICLAKEVEDLRVKVAELTPPVPELEKSADSDHMTHDGKPQPDPFP